MDQLALLQARLAANKRNPKPKVIPTNAVVHNSSFSSSTSSSSLAADDAIIALQNRLNTTTKAKRSVPTKQIVNTIIDVDNVTNIDDVTVQSVDISISNEELLLKSRLSSVKKAPKKQSYVEVTVSNSSTSDFSLSVSATNANSCQSISASFTSDSNYRNVSTTFTNSSSSNNRGYQSISTSFTNGDINSNNSNYQSISATFTNNSNNSINRYIGDDYPIDDITFDDVNTSVIQINYTAELPKVNEREIEVLTESFDKIPILTTSVLYSIGTHYHKKDSRLAWEKRLATQSVKQNFNPSDIISEKADVEENDKHSRDENELRILAKQCLNLEHMTDDQINQNPRHVVNINKKITFFKEEREYSEYYPTAMSNLKLKSTNGNDYDMTMREKILKQAKEVAKAIAKRSPKKSEKIVATNIKKINKIIDEADRRIIEQLSQCSPKDVSSLSKIGTYTTRLSNLELVRDALIAVWSRLPKDDIILKKNVYLEIFTRNPIMREDVNYHSLFEFGESFPRDQHILFALEHRADVMEPFSPLIKPRFQWDPFQLEALRLIKEGISVVVSAPTSSGKSLLAQYCTTLDENVVLIYPTQELVDQQASEIRRRKSGSLSYTPIVHIIGDSIYADENSKIVIGTPQSVLNYFTLQNTKHRMLSKNELDILMDDFDNIGIDRRSAHLINLELLKPDGEESNEEDEDEDEDEDDDENEDENEEETTANCKENNCREKKASIPLKKGYRYRKIVKSIKIPDMLEYKFLVVDEMQQANLNDDQARSMINLMKLFSHATQIVLSATIINVEEVVEWIKTIKGNDRVRSVVYNKRFINQEKQVYSDGRLQVVSPLSVLTVELIQSGVLFATEMQFPTPQLYDLSLKIEMPEVNVVRFFENKPVTLYTCKSYEEELKHSLTSLSNTDPEKLQNILDQYKIPDVNISNLGIPELYSILKTLQKNNMLKAMVFVFDMVKCREICHQLWEYMDSEEKRRFPLWYDIKKIINECHSRFIQTTEKIQTKVTRDNSGSVSTADQLSNRVETVETTSLNSFKTAVRSKIEHEIHKWREEIDINSSILKFFEHEVMVLNTMKTVKDIEIYLQDENIKSTISRVKSLLLNTNKSFLDAKEWAIQMFTNACNTCTMTNAIYNREINIINSINQNMLELMSYARSEAIPICLTFVQRMLNKIYLQMGSTGEEEVNREVLSIINEIEEKISGHRTIINNNVERIDTYTKESTRISYMEKLSSVNEYEPHPDYTFSSMPISISEKRQVIQMLRHSTTKGRGKNKKTIRERDQFRPDITWGDQYMLWFERGFTIYTKNLKDLDVRFQGMAQILMEKYGVQLLFSDISYAYGVNLPIRTVIFYNPCYNEIGLEELPIILAHQAQGRGARRGLDTRGYVVYVGVEHKRLMLGKYLKIEGCESLNNYSGAPILFNPLFMIGRLAKIGLQQFCNCDDTIEDRLTYIRSCEESNKQILIDNIKKFQKNDATWSMQSYRLAQVTDNFNILQHLVAYFTELEHTTTLEFGIFEFCKAVAQLIFYDQEDDPDNTTINFEKFISGFIRRTNNLGYRFKMGVVADLPLYINGGNIMKVNSDVLIRMKKLAEVLALLHDNNHLTTAKWIKLAYESLVRINNLIFKNTI